MQINMQAISKLLSGRSKLALIIFVVLFAFIWLFPPQYLYFLKGLSSYLPLHMLMETFSIIVAAMIFAVGWEAYMKEKSGNIVIISTAFLAVVFIDFAHMLSFAGMPPFVTPADPEKAIFFWLCGRFVVAFGMLYIAINTWKPLKSTTSHYLILSVSLMATVLVYWVGLWHQDILPHTFIPGKGLTPLKIYLEWSVVLLLVVAAVFMVTKMLIRKQEYDAENILMAIFLMIMSEIFFMLYADVADLYNFMGHVYKVIAYYYLYRAIFADNIHRPYLELDKSKTMVMDLYNNAPCGYHSIDKDGVFVNINDTELSWLGYTREEMVGKMKFSDMLTPSSLEIFRKNFPIFREHGWVKDMEFEVVRKDGSVFSVLVSATAVKDESGNFLMSRSTLYDITDIKKAEKALEKSEERYRTLIRKIEAAVVVHRADTSIMTCNPKAQELLGLTEEQLMGKTAMDPAWHFYHQDRSIMPYDEYPVNHVLRTRQSLRNLIVGVHRPARENDVWVLVNADPVFNDDGSIEQVIVTFSDISEMVRVEEYLRESEEKFAAAFHASPNLMAITRVTDGVILDVNEGYSRLLGYSRAESLGRMSNELSIWADPADRLTFVAAIEKYGQITDFETKLRRKDGTIISVIDSARTIELKGEKCILSVVYDITERKRAEDALKLASAYNRSLIEASLDPLVTISAEGKITDVNTATEDVTGYSRSELIGMDFSDYFTDPEKARAGYREVFNVGFVKDYPLEIRHRDGRITPVLYNASVYKTEAGDVIGVFAAARDITERKKAEEELQEKDRHAQSLLRLSKNLELAQNYAEVLKAAEDEVKGTIGYQNIWVYLFSEDKKYAYSLAAGGSMSDIVMSGENTARLTVTGDPMMEEIVSAKDIVVVEDAQTDPRTDKKIVTQLKNRTLINVPIIFFDRNMGSVGMGTFGDEGIRVPTDAQKEYLKAMASHMAVTLDRIHLLVERKKAEAEIRKLNRIYSMLSECNQSLVRADDENKLIANICRIITEEGGYRMAWVGYPQNDKEQTIKPVAYAGFEEGYLSQRRFSWGDNEYGRGPTGTAIRTGKYVTILNYNTDPDFAPWKEEAQKRGYASSVAFPLVTDSKPFGALSIYGGVNDVFNEEELILLQELASDLAFGIITIRTKAEREHAQAMLNEAQRIAHLGNWELDLINNVLTWSDEIYHMFEIDLARFGASYEAFLNAIHPDDRDAVNFAYTHSLETKQPYSIDHRLLFPDGRIKYVHEQCETYYDETGKPFRSVGTVQDVTEQKKAEKEILKLNRVYRTLSACNEALVHAQDEASLLSDICSIIVEKGGYRMAWVGYKQEDEQKNVRPMAQAGYEEGYLESTRVTWSDEDLGRGPTGTAIRTGEISINKAMLTNPLMLPWRDEAIKRGYASSVGLPLKDNGDTFASLTLYAAEPDAFNEEEVKLLRELAADLAYGIVTLRTRIERHEAEVALEQSERYLRTIIETSPMPMGSVNKEGQITLLNDAFVRTFGYTVEDIHHVEIWFTQAYPDKEYREKTVGEWMRSIDEFVRSGTPIPTLEVTITAKDGSTRIVDLYTTHLESETFVIFHDITEKKHFEETIRHQNEELEHKVQERTAQLEVANKELEAFTYSVSHDLRAPLRSIDGFSTVVMEDYGDKLGEDGKEYLQRVRNASQKMSHLIDDLLSLSRLTRGDLNRVEANLSNIAADVIKALREAEPARAIEINVAENILCDADPRLMEVVLTNLLNNAWKFTSKKENAKVEFGYTEKEGKTVYYVKDNGAGFDMNYASKMFQPFQRLHTEEEFPGTGIGLATVYRIIKKHGGDIWAEGKVGEGATFFFTLGE